MTDALLSKVFVKYGGIASWFVFSCIVFCYMVLFGLWIVCSALFIWPIIAPFVIVGVAWMGVKGGDE